MKAFESIPMPESREVEASRLIAALEQLSKSAQTQEYKNKIDDALYTIRRSVEGEGK